ncbi:MAG: glycerol-3-phosphate 1-O-acyltransferase PlsY [Acidobacteria bacterium]|nr:glycerol-3-phosphate 1-O-acyltransferase PlsY [Acidobacteriota bacterium]
METASAWNLLLVAALAYLLGSVPFGYLLYRLLHGSDIRAAGSGNIGATNVLRTSGVAAGLATFVLDAAKGYVAVALCAAFVGDAPEWRSVAAVAVILGHIFPLFLQFRGGKGVATAFGAFLALAPSAVLIALVVFLMVVSVWRYVSLASLVAAAVFPLVLLAFGESSFTLTAAFIGSALLIVRHRSNIRRLLQGTENRITFRGATG